VSTNWNPPSSVQAAEPAEESEAPEELPAPQPVVASVTDSSTPVVSAPPAPKGVKVPKWEADARERLKVALRRFAKPLADLVARDANEGDTRLLITDFLCEGLGYDKYENLTTEYQVKGEFADDGIRLDKQLVAFIEVKRCTTKLGDKHLRQVQSYAVNEGVEWVWLSNGQTWQVWHITGGLPIVMDLAIEVDLLAVGSPSSKIDQLFYLTKESFKRKQIDELWQVKKATSPQSLAKIVLSPSVVDAIRKELWRQTKHSVEASELQKILKGVVREELLG
jgi:hypothetical protein